MNARAVLVGLTSLVLVGGGAGSLALAHDGPGHGSGGGSGGAAFHEGTTKLDRLRYATARYFSVDEAVEAGYGELRDAEGIACIDHPEGGMGIHYVNGDLVGDAEVRLRSPELMVYEPQADGDLELVALEYVVFKSAWREEHPTGRPELMGRRFALVDEPNRYGLPPFYELHVWAWRDNPAGMFDDWNPDVTCENAPAD